MEDAGHDLFEDRVENERPEERYESFYARLIQLLRNLYDEYICVPFVKSLYLFVSYILKLLKSLR